ncbi:MAG: cytidylate kinase-like family protein, partial [Gemmataceae bacterium]|nr:cytidylate kinase-like family protein [Gemmataceae bacterium]
MNSRRSEKYAIEERGSPDWRNRFHPTEATIMSERSTSYAEDTALPLHGFRGTAEAAPAFPRSLTIAISREAGARGGTIAKRAGEKLGWQVFTQELLEYISHEGTFRQDVFDA